jgi:hypothetical protein
MKFALTLALVAAGMLFPGAARAQEQTINAYVRALVEEAVDPDLEALVGAIQLEEIAEFDVYQVAYAIDPAKQYHVYAACDEDCRDIDLTAYGNDDAEIQSDHADDAMPMLIISPHEAGDRLIVELEMLQCAADVCVFGIGLYEVWD